MPWTPIADAELVPRVEDTVDAIATDLKNREAAAPSYAGGHAGVALFFAYLAEHRRDEHLAEVAEAHLERALQGATDQALPAALFGGFTGIAWTHLHISRRLFEDDGQGVTDELDEALLEHLQRHPWTADYDVVSGLVGLAVYGLHHPNPAIARRALDHLERLAKPREPGVAWWTAPELLIPPTRKAHPDGYYNLGLAHGTPGVIAVLARMCARPDLRDRAKALLAPAVRWLLAQRNDGTGGTCFSYYAGRSSSSRIAWCYGDPGVAIALMAAAQALDEPTWEAQATVLAEHCKEVDFETTQIVDASLCHGGAGLMHFFARMHHATGDPQLADAARHWLRWTLDFGSERPGFPSLQPKGLDAANKDWVDDPGLLMGAAGVGLALLAAIARKEPSWDAPLLMDIRPKNP